MEWISLFRGIEMGLDKFLQRILLKILHVRFPKAVFKGQFVGCLKTSERQLQIKIIEIIAEKFADFCLGVALHQIIADAMQNLYQGTDVKAGR